MSTTSGLVRRAIVPLAGAALLLSACGGNTIAKDEVEKQIVAELASDFDDPQVDCPNDLEGEVGATMECDVTVDISPEPIGVTVTVESIEDGVANYSVVVTDPVEDSGSDDSAPADEEVPAEEEITEEEPVEEEPAE